MCAASGEGVACSERGAGHPKAVNHFYLVHMVWFGATLVYHVNKMGRRYYVVVAENIVAIDRTSAILRKEDWLNSRFYLLPLTTRCGSSNTSRLTYCTSSHSSIHFSRKKRSGVCLASTWRRAKTCLQRSSISQSLSCHLQKLSV